MVFSSGLTFWGREHTQSFNSDLWWTPRATPAKATADEPQEGDGVMDTMVDEFQSYLNMLMSCFVCDNNRDHTKAGFGLVGKTKTKSV